MIKDWFDFTVVGGIILTALISIVLVVGGFALIIWLIANPAVIGEFFGNIVNGFNSVGR